MVCVQGWPFKGLEGFGHNLSFLKYKINYYKNLHFCDNDNPYVHIVPQCAVPNIMS